MALNHVCFVLCNCWSRLRLQDPFDLQIQLRMFKRNSASNIRSKGIVKIIVVECLKIQSRLLYRTL